MYRVDLQSHTGRVLSSTLETGPTHVADRTNHGRHKQTLHRLNIRPRCPAAETSNQTRYPVHPPANCRRFDHMSDRDAAVTDDTTETTWPVTLTDVVIYRRRVNDDNYSHPRYRKPRLTERHNSGAREAIVGHDSW